MCRCVGGHREYTSRRRGGTLRIQYHCTCHCRLDCQRPCDSQLCRQRVSSRCQDDSVDCTVGECSCECIRCYATSVSPPRRTSSLTHLTTKVAFGALPYALESVLLPAVAGGPALRRCLPLGEEEDACPVFCLHRCFALTGHERGCRTSKT
eukprot:6771434-Prymnesium_polylepis.2